MRIRNLHIDGFGRFADRSFGPLEHPVTVFYGANEAGKSTLLEFIRRILFGFPARRVGTNEYPPLAGGRHGGRITIATDAGEIIVVDRAPGRGEGPISMTTDAGETIPDAELPRLLGNHTRGVFNNIFAFTLDELHDESLLGNESVNRQIYSAGIGAVRLPTALDTLQSQKQEIFRPRGSNQAVPKVIAQIQETDTALRSIAEHGVEYRRQSERLAEIERELGDLGERRLQLMSEKEWNEDLERAWEPWNGLINAEGALAKLPVVEAFPENGIVLLETLEARAQTADQELALAEKRVKHVKADVDQEIEHLGILKQSDKVRDLTYARSAFDQSVKDLPERRAELSAKRSELSASLANLGQDWDADRLNSFDLSLVVREEVASHGERLQNARTNDGRSRTALAQEETALADARVELERAQAARDGVAPPELDETDIRERRRRTRQSRSTLDELGRAEDRSRDLRAQVDDDLELGEASPNTGGARLRAGLLGTLGVAVLVAGIWLSLTASPAGGSALTVIGAVLFAAAAILLFRGRSSGLATASPVAARVRRQINEADEQLAGVRSSLQADAEALGLASLDADALMDAEEALDGTDAKLREWQQLEAQLAQMTERGERQTLRRDQAQQAVQDTRAILEAEEQVWQVWLQQRGLLTTFSPDGIQELRTLADLARTHHRDVVELQDRIAAIQTDIDEFTAMVRPLAGVHGFEAEWNDYPKVAGVADDIIDLHGSVSEAARARTNADNELEEAQNELTQRQESRQGVAGEIAALLQSGQAEDVDNFRGRSQIFQERAALSASISGVLEQMQVISGPGDALEKLRNTLSKTDIQTIREEVRKREADLEELDARRSELDTERGAIQTRLKDLASEEDSSRLRLERHRLSEELQGHARDWAVRTIAESLIRQAQSKFEKERQPDVIRHAERFFLDVTDGAYEAVFSPLGSSEINVRDAAGNIRTPQQLSRGTREQLFLALRFGLILELGQRSERLPVIVDEALVNFDPTRGTRAAGSFIELSETNQVLVFTCHPQIVDWFADAAAQRGAAEPEVVRI